MSKVAITMIAIVVIIVIIVILATRIDTNESIDNFVKQDRTILATGPFLVQQQRLYVYNPSIAYDDAGEIVGVSRLTGKIATECSYYQPSDFKENQEVTNELKQYPTSLQPNQSSVVMWHLNRLPQITILPIFSSKNTCNEIKEFEYSLGFEDPRLFRYQGNLWIYGHFRGSLSRDGGCRHLPVIARMDRLDRLIPLRTDRMKGMEKNWMPFEYQNRLYFVYEISPHTILECDLSTGECRKVYQTNALKGHPIAQHHIGGGAPAFPFEWEGQRYFLTVAHTRNNIPRIIRKNFFYVFRGRPPFDVVMVSPIFDVMEDGRDIEFASGLLLDPAKKTIIISAGVSDCYSVMSRYPLSTVMKEMIRV